jgi:hypothetical protein
MTPEHKTLVAELEKAAQWDDSPSQLLHEAIAAIESLSAQGEAGAARIGPELWGRSPITGFYEQIDDGGHTEEKVAEFEAIYAEAGWTGLRRDNPFQGSPHHAPAPVPDAVGDGKPTHRHKKRGTEYVLIGIGRMQCDWWQITGAGYRYPVDMAEVAIYRSVDDGSLWVRPREEFEDGRFEALAASGESSR